jgi:hypothetical protein
MLVPGVCQGQIIECSFGWCRGELYQCVLDRSDRSVQWYRADPVSRDRLLDEDYDGARDWEPTVDSWIPCDEPNDDEEEE